MIPNAKSLRHGELSLRRKSGRMKATLLPRNNYASTISDRLSVDPIICWKLPTHSGLHVFRFERFDCDRGAK